MPGMSLADRLRLLPAVDRPRLLLAACLGLTILCSLWSIRQEMLVRAAQERLQLLSQRIDQAMPVPPEQRSAPSLPWFAPPRLLLTDALYLARLATVAPDNRTGRQALLNRAREEIAEAVLARPHWGEAWIARGYVESIRHPGFGETERYALIRSYLDAPYVHDAGLWRTARSLPYWHGFPRSTQRLIAWEALWFLCRDDYQTKRRLLDLIRASPAYRPIFLLYGQRGCRT